MLFLKIQYNGINHIIKLPQLNYTDLTAAVKEVLKISEVRYFAGNDVELDKEDVVDYIGQYTNDSNFILFIRDDNTELNILYSPSSPPVNLHTQVYTYEDLNLEAADNFSTKEELQVFLEKHHRLALENFKTKQKLTNAERVKISKSIVQHLLTVPTRILSTTDLQNISILIAEVFVGELPTTFYQKFCQGRHASGKLHDAYNNYRAALSASGLISRRSKSITPVRNQLDLDEANTADEKAEIDSALKILKTEVILDGCINAWKKTFSRRQQQLRSEISTSEYIKQYPALEQPDGYKLYLIDTEHVIKADIVLDIPNEFVSKIVEQLQYARFGSVNKIVQLIAEESNETNKPILALMLLPFLFPPSLKRGKSGVVKLSKAECADSFICHFPDLNLADSGIRNILQKSTELQPFVIFIGSPVKTAWVIVAHMKYCFTDLTSCMKCAIAAYIALNIKYPSKSEKAWFFLQKYFFNISTSYDKSLENGVKTFANDFNLIRK